MSLTSISRSSSNRRFLRQRFPDRHQSDRAVIAGLTNELLQFDFDSIESVEKMLIEAADVFAQYEAEHPPNSKPGSRFADVGVVRISLRETSPAYERFLNAKARNRRAASATES